METTIIITIAVIGIAVWLFIRHQNRLRRNAYMIRESIRNRDFMFRLGTSGLLYGEAAMQETLNSLGDTIRKSVRESEVRSWENMTRVLTHEIMNSIAPIMSISQTMLDFGSISDPMIKEGVTVISDTAQRLNAFVDSFRKMSMLQKPSPTTFPVSEVCTQLEGLYPEVIESAAKKTDLTIHTDKNMLMQVLINLCKNALEAGASRIGVECVRNNDDSTTQIILSNNGDPIPAEVRDDIFTPFFTTKERGSGIGLSVCREIIVMQGGKIELLDTPLPGFHTSFLIEV